MTSTGSRSVQPDTTWEGGGERAGHLQGVIEGSFAEYRKDRLEDFKSVKDEVFGDDFSKNGPNEKAQGMVKKNTSKYFEDVDGEDELGIE